MANPFEKPPMPSPEKSEKEKPKTSAELIKEDKDLRAEFFKLREKLAGKEISQEEEKKIAERLEEINKKSKPITKELDSKSEGLYSEIMDISVRKPKGTSDEKWQDIIKKSGEVLKEAEAKLGKMEDADPNIKKYLEERIKQKREQLGIKDIETWERIKSQKAKEEKTKEELEKEVEEKESKPGLRTPEERQKEIERIWAEQEKPEGERKEVKEEQKPSVEVEETKEKTKEELEKELEERRKIYAEARKQSREVLAKGKKEKKLKELLEAYEPTIKPVREKYILAGDSEKLKQGDKEAEERRKNFIEKLTTSGIKKEKAEAIYEKELKEAEYEEAKFELGKKLSEQGVKDAEIFERLANKEKEILNQLKVESWPPKEKNIFRKGMEWWMRRGRVTRLVISTALITGVVASVGGFGATAAAIFAGRRFVSGFGGIIAAHLAGKGVDLVISRDIKRKKEAAMEKLKAGFNLKNLRETSKEVEKIFEETAKRERGKLLIKGGIMAVVGAGAAIGLGMFEQAWAGSRTTAEAPAKPAAPSPDAQAKPAAPSPDAQAKPAVPSPDAPAKPAVPSPEEQAKAAAPSPEEQAKPGIAPETIPKPTPAIENIVKIQKGDSIWKIIDRQLEANYGQKFTSLNEAQKTYIIDALKDEIAENPKSFGLEDIDKIKTGQKIDLTSIFEDKAGIENSFKRAGDLNQTQIEQIKHNNEVLRNWLKEHPGQRLTSERVEEILGKGKIMPAPPETPAAEASTTKAPAPPETPVAEAPITEAPAPEVLKDYQELAIIMDANEIANIKALGLTEGEYKAIQNLTVGEFLERVPDEAHLFGGQIPDPEIASPYHGILGAIELEKHLKLADFIRSFEPGEEIKEMTVRQFLRTVGPKGTVIM